MKTERVHKSLAGRIMTAREAAALVGPGRTVACSGFTMVGNPKAVPAAMAELGQAVGTTLLTGASVGDVLDGSLARAGLVARRYPYQTNADMRAAINGGQVDYVDMHLSHMPVFLNRAGGIPIDVAVVECAAVTEQGIIPAAAVGAADSFVARAERVILEVNGALPMALCGLHDIYAVDYAAARPIPIHAVQDRIGTSYSPGPPEKIAAFVLTDDPGEFPVFNPAGEAAAAICTHIVDFLKQEVAEGRQPEHLAPLQSGVGSVANAVFQGLAASGFCGMRMYTEVIQDAALHLLLDGSITAASATALSLSEQGASDFYRQAAQLSRRLVLRPQELANHPEIVRRLGLISMNTPIECDIYGNVNSTHIMGSRVMNGIGGSGDFARNAGLSIFATESVAKGGLVSSIVPMVSHVDHTEHDVQVIVTEQGLADLRWKSPRERAELIIERCAHPDYRPMLREYLQSARRYGGHIPHDLEQALSWHVRYQHTGSMK